MAPLLGMNPSDYRSWELRTHRVSGLVAALLLVIRKEPAAVKRALPLCSRAQTDLRLVAR